MLDFSKVNPRRLLLLELAAMLLVVLMAALVRYPNLATNPGWYTDEGTLIDIASHIDRGEVQYMALEGPLLMVGRQPLFVYLLAFIFRFTGEGMLPLRTLSATLGILSIIALYGMVRTCLGVKGIPLAILAALLLAISPMGILYSRVAFSYSLLTPLVLLCMLAAWKYSHTGSRPWLVMAALMVGIGMLNDLAMFTLLVPLVVVVLVRRWKDVFLTLGLALLPMAVYLGILLLTQTQATLLDLGYLFTRLNGFSPLAYVPAWIMNYGLLLDHDHWFLPALIGLFLLEPMRFRQFVFLFWAVPVLMMARSVIVAGIGYYYLSPFLPLLALGVAAVILYGIPRIFATAGDAFRFIVKRWIPGMNKAGFQRLAIGSRIFSAITLAGIVLFPLAFYYFNSMYQVNTHFANSMDWILVDPAAGQKAITYLNDRVAPEDLVIASPTLAWALRCRTADFQMALVIDGVGTPHFPAGVDPSRFAYDTRPERARYVVMDPVWDHFGIKSIPEVAVLAQSIEDQWNLVFRDGDVRIYENPWLSR